MGSLISSLLKSGQPNLDDNRPAKVLFPVAGSPVRIATVLITEQHSIPAAFRTALRLVAAEGFAYSQDRETDPELGYARGVVLPVVVDF